MMVNTLLAFACGRAQDSGNGLSPSCNFGQI
jgi:hypothetical protein